MDIKEIQAELQDFKKWVYVVLNGNGRPGMKEQIASIKAWQKIQFALEVVIVAAVIKMVLA